jgi:ribosomal protein L11 methyltransferase
MTTSTQNLKWTELIFSATPSNTEALEQALLKHGALAITLYDAQDQPILEPPVGTTPLWDDIKLHALFETPCDVDVLTYSLQANYPELTIPSPTIKQVADKDWERAWLDDYHPMQFGDNLWVCPSPITPPNPDAVNVMLDPGLAFGTGTHPTTALCLRYLGEQDLTGKTIVDYGCGSGILAIAALKLGAAKAICIDNDPQALTATLDNAQRNGIDAKKLHVFLPDDAPETTCDVLVANILCNPLLSLRDHFSTLLNPNGCIALSGILDTQIEGLAKHYSQQFTLNSPQHDEQWVMVSGQKY